MTRLLLGAYLLLLAVLLAVAGLVLLRPRVEWEPESITFAGGGA